MTASTIATVQELAARFRAEERNLTLYFADLETAPAPGSLNRVFGPPVGLTDEQWPTFPELAELLQQANSMQHWEPRDQRMEHVFTVDLRGLELVGVPADAVAMTLFISNASFHRACRDGNPHTAVRFLREQDLHHGVYQGSLPRRSLYRWSRRFSLVPIDVPGDVFDVPELELAADDPLVALYAAIGQAPARLGGCPIGVREPTQAGAWAESSPTLPWSGARPSVPASFVQESSLTIPYSPAREVAPHHAAHSSLTIPYSPDLVLDSSRTVAYSPHHVLDSSRTVAYSPRRASESSRSREPRTPFLMQFQRGFADVNLGNRGVMYVSGRSAYMPSL
jgi:hypothetical protein